MPRRVDATEQLLSEVRRRVPLQFLIHTGHSMPRIGPGEVAFWKDTSTGRRGVGKIVMRIGRDRFVISSSREQVSVGSGEVLVSDTDQFSGTLTEKLLVSAPLTKTITTSSEEPGDTYTLGLDQSGIDHGSLGGLGDDDHTQYLLLAGRSGGQHARGGTGSGNDLKLESTSASSKGALWLEPNTTGRVVFGQREYDPYVDDNKWSGRFFMSGSAGEGTNSPPTLCRVTQFVESSSVEWPVAFNVAQYHMADTSSTALLAENRPRTYSSLGYSRALHARVSPDSGRDPDITTAIGITGEVRAIGNSTYTTARGLEARLYSGNSAVVETWDAFLAAAPDSHSGGTKYARGLHVEAIGGDSSDGCDAILIDAQDTKFDGLSGNVRLAGGDWNTGHLQLGQAHLWASSGDLHLSRATPTSATDADLSVLASTVDFHGKRGTNLADPTDPQDAATKAYVDAASGTTDHGSLSGLGDDDHPQYFLLAGRSGGQTAYGGSGDSEDLTLQSTSGATPGKIWLEPNTGGRLVIGNYEYDPYVSDNKYSGRFFVSAADGDGPDGATAALHVMQKADRAATYPYALSVAQRIFADARGSAVFANAQFHASTSTDLARAVYAYVSTAGSANPTPALAIGVTGRVEASNSADYTEARSFHAQAAIYGSAKIRTWDAFHVEAPDSIAAGLTDVRGLHIGDIGIYATNSCDAILVDAQDDGFDGLSGNVRMAGGDWNTGHLQLGQAHVWATSGDLRFSRTEPSSATDYDFAILTSTVDVKSRRVVNLADPTSAQDAATKAYVDAHAGGGGLSDAYSSITDGSNTATASGGDTFKLRSANDRLSITVTNDDATHGDNALFTLNEGNIVHQNLSGAGSHDHSAIDSHIDASSGVHGISGSVVGTTDTQTLTNKTLTSPTISSPSISDASLSGTSSVSGTLSVSAATTFTGAVDAGGAPSLEVPNAAGGTTLSNAGEVTVNTSARTLKFHDGSSARVLNPLRRFSVTIESPSDSENITLTHVNEGWVLRKVIVVLRGSSSPSVTFNLKHSASRADTSPSSVWATDKTASSETTGDSWTTFDSANIGSGRYLWLTTSATAGDVSEMNITVYYDEA